MELVRLTRQIDKGECSLRNALTNKPVGLVLLAGQVGTVIERFGGGNEFLVEFGSRGPDQCDWLGVLKCRSLDLI
jgi:hypothetical protein